MNLPSLPARPAESHKGDYGRALLVGGSRGMAGAIGLSAIAALRGGAGLVTVATAASCLETVASFQPAAVTAALPDDPAGRISAEAVPALLELASHSTCLGLGPGLGRGDSLDALVAALYRQLEVPMVVDADALNALAGKVPLQQVAGPRVLTPHPGEFRRLAGTTSDLAGMQQQAKEMAVGQVTVVLKGHRTLVTHGGAMYENATGNAGMATAGSGDVLTGLIVALLAQGMSTFEAAQLGVFLHGLAGDLAAERLGMHSLIATDICDHLPMAFLQYARDDKGGTDRA